VEPFYGGAAVSFFSSDEAPDGTGSCGLNDGPTNCSVASKEPCGGLSGPMIFDNLSGFSFSVGPAAGPMAGPIGRGRLACLVGRAGPGGLLTDALVAVSAVLLIEPCFRQPCS
jgi:hypothetical protein